MKHRWRLSLGAGVLAASAVVSWATVPALASHGARRLSAVIGSSPAATSQVFAGWGFGKTKVASSTIEYKAPSITCTAATQGVNPGAYLFSGSSSSPREQAAGLLVACVGRHKQYTPDLIINNAEMNLANPVASGDLIKVTVAASTRKVSATIADLTSPRAFSKTLNGVGSPALQEADGDGLVVASGGSIPVVKFATIAFTKGAISSKPLGSVTPRASENMQTGSTLQIATTALTPSGSTANAFTTVWKHS
jgi:hypothetical protein